MNDTPSGLLAVWHSRTGAAAALARAAARGGRAAGENVRLLAAARCRPADLLAVSGYLFVCPENLAAMSGAMKEMFDRAYYPLLDCVAGRPYATIVAAGSDGEGATRQIDRIVTGWRLRRVAPALIVNLGAQSPAAILAAKQIPAAALERAATLGATLAGGIALGIY